MGRVDKDCSIIHHQNPSPVVNHKPSSIIHHQSSIIHHHQSSIINCRPIARRFWGVLVRISTCSTPDMGARGHLVFFLDNIVSPFGARTKWGAVQHAGRCGMSLRIFWFAGEFQEKAYQMDFFENTCAHTTLIANVSKSINCCYCFKRKTRPRPETMAEGHG